MNMILNNKKRHKIDYSKDSKSINPGGLPPVIYREQFEVQFSVAKKIRGLFDCTNIDFLKSWG